MSLEIRPLRKQDFDRVIQFAITGMHFDHYTQNRTILNLYGRYFWYLELERASQVLAAYEGDQLAGVLLADMKGEKKAFQSFWRQQYVRIINFLQKIFYKDGVGPYDAANKEMFSEFAGKQHLDGEINFLAADPNAQTRGIGTALLQELEKREAGKTIYLYTDNNCTWQFYEHRGFKRVGEKQIALEFDDMGEVPLSCYLYSKVCGASA